MDNQQAFDIMVTGLSARGWTKAVLVDVSDCVYRNEEGVACAVGLLIPSGRYKEDIEGLDPQAALSECGVENSCSWRFLADAQRAHDFGDSPAEMRVRFRMVARGHSLTWPEGVE